MKVARIARLIAEQLIDKIEDDKQMAAAIRQLGGLDPDVVEAAALGHDLGHPPFGHCGEQKLDQLIRSILPEKQQYEVDGFEGNAQSFRIVTKLAPRHTSIAGLNLTRATLNALLKYPRLRGSDSKYKSKFGAYSSERAYFDWVRKESTENVRTLEANIMDWADDIAYAIHDLEDFYKGGLIPLDRLTLPTVLFDEEEWAKFEASDTSDDSIKDGHDYFMDRQHFVDYLQAIGIDKELGIDPKTLSTILDDMLGLLGLTRPYDGSWNLQVKLRERSAGLIERAVNQIKILDGELVFDIQAEIEVLKQLTIFYVINSRSLQSQQNGQRKIIELLFGEYIEASRTPRSHAHPSILPEQFFVMLDREKEALDKHKEAHEGNFSDEELRARRVADLISQMTDEDALLMYKRLSGNEPGSIFDQVS